MPLKKQQNLPQEEVDLIDFSEVPVLSKIIPSENVNFDKQKMEILTKELSSVFSHYPNLNKSGVKTYVYNADAYYLNSENVKYKVPFSLVCVRIYAEAVALDGEPLIDYINLYFKTPDQIPSLESLKVQVNQMASMLTQLCKAPSIKESYSGPVMFEGDAVGELVSQCFINNPNGLLASRKAIASTPDLAQSYGQYLPKENDLEQFYGKKIVAREISVAANYTQKYYQGIPLIGYIELDAQGVEPVKSLKLVEDGVLKTLLTDRTPTLRNQNSNGHNCFTISDGKLTGALNSGIIEVSSTDTSAYKILKDKLIATAKEEDYEYAYIIRKMASPTAGVPGLNLYLSNNRGTFGISRPIYIYRISVKDGKEELIRSAKISSVSIKSFKRMIGVTGKKHVYNTLQRNSGVRYYSWYSDYGLLGTPVSYIIPDAIVFQELEIEKDKNIVLKKETIVPSPLISDN